MPELRDNRKDRRSKLKEYFRRNCRTTAQVVDFIGGLQHAVSVNYEYATAEEILEWENLLE